MPINVQGKQMRRAFTPSFIVKASEIINRIFIDSTYEAVDLYDMQSDLHSHKVGTKNRLIIFNYSTLKQYKAQGPSLDAAMSIFGIPNSFTEFLATEGAGIPFVSENGIAVAEFFPEYHTLNILFDLAFDESEAAFGIFEELMKRVDEFQEEERNKYSWKKTKNREFLIDHIKRVFSTGDETALNEKRRRIRTLEENIETYRQEIFSKTRSLLSDRKSLAAIEAGRFMGEKVLEDLDNIANFEKITDVRLDENYLTFKTVPLYCFDEAGNRYYVGSFNVKINLQQADVKFYGDNPRQGHWTDHDPHPHVSGSSGNACLGSIASTVAELSAQHQYYPLALTLIDFLEAVNTDDSAGAKVRNWDKVDGEGNIILAGGATMFDCEYCERTVERDETTVVWQNQEEMRVCEGCHDEHFHWSDTADRYIHNDDTAERYTEDEGEEVTA